MQTYDEKKINSIKETIGIDKKLIIIALRSNKGDEHKVIVEYTDNEDKFLEKYSSFKEIDEEVKEN